MVKTLLVKVEILLFQFVSKFSSQYNIVSISFSSDIQCQTSPIITVSSTDTVITSNDVFSVSTATFRVVESKLGESSSTSQTDTASCSCTMTEQVSSDTQTG